MAKIRKPKGKKICRQKYVPIRKVIFSEKQKVLAEKHGTPAEFAAAAYAAVPGAISMDEARAAIDKYNREWQAAY